MPAEFLCNLPKNLTTHLTHKLYSVFPLKKGIPYENTKHQTLSGGSAGSGFAAGCCSWGVFWNRHRGAAPAVVETAQENAAEQVVFFRQKDDRWKTDTLGDSVYHMADSGCLTCCVAAALQMQQISVDGLPENADAGEVNQFFSEHGVYDSAGNLLWEMLEQTAGVSVRKQDAAELQDGELDQELAAGRYPIVRVKMPKSGSYHYVLLVGSADGTYLCMDPLQTKEQTVPLSDFGGKIYAVRVLQS